MIRGGKVNLAILGAMEVSETGDLANWMIPGKMVKGMGGAMDLASGAARLIVTMNHTDPDGTPKIVQTCTLPVTARGVTNMVITDRAVFEFRDGQLTLTGLMPGSTLEEIRASTGATFVEALRE